jgi:ubiquinone/menaquinone biosynthesis C-methylase UbiE
MTDSETFRWGRLVFLRRRPAFHGEDDAGPPAPGGLAAGFRPTFAEYLRAQYARAVEGARAFVAYCAPEAGAAVVEVGAGSGRITFDGGLAQAVGPDGQDLLTDPSGPQLDGAIRRARALGLGWVRALRAPAEDLPLASGTADMVVGYSFLQFTDQDRALAEIARVVRPGGRVGIGAGLDHPWPRAWQETLEPVHAELRAWGLAHRPLFPSADELLARVARAGLVVERTRVAAEIVDFPSVDVAVAFWRSNSLIVRLLQEVPALRHAAVREAFEAGVREMFASTALEERRLGIPVMDLVARRPG